MSVPSMLSHLAHVPPVALTVRQRRRQNLHVLRTKRADFINDLEHLKRWHSNIQ